MKILHVCAGWEDTNGAAVIARRIAERQAARGDEVSFATWVSPAALRRADEVWTHCGWLPCLWWAGLFARRLVRMPEACYDPVRLKYSAWKKRLVRPFERLFLRRAARVVATCAAEKDWIEKYEPKAKAEVVDIRGFGWGPKVIIKVRPKLSLSTPRVLYMGRRHPLKGVRFLEEAVRRLGFGLRVVSEGRLRRARRGEGGGVRLVRRLLPADFKRELRHRRRRGALARQEGGHHRRRAGLGGRSGTRRRARRGARLPEGISRRRRRGARRDARGCARGRGRKEGIGGVGWELPSTAWWDI